MPEFKRYEDLNDIQKVIRENIHDITHDCFIKTWNKISEKLNNFTPISGDDAMSYFSTACADICARFIFYIKKINEGNDSWYSLDEIQEGIFEGVSLHLETKKISKENKIQNLGEIKKINYK